jgi:hypothetical protein
VIRVRTTIQHRHNEFVRHVVVVARTEIVGVCRARRREYAAQRRERTKYEKAPNCHLHARSPGL